MSGLFVLVCKVRDVWEWLNCMHVGGGGGAVMSRCGFRSVRCSEFRGGRFSEVTSVFQVRDFQSVTRTLSALGSVSASRSVRSGRFYCISTLH